jgi:hypothetical protein
MPAAAYRFDLWRRSTESGRSSTPLSFALAISLPQGRRPTVGTGRSGDDRLYGCGHGRVSHHAKVLHQNLLVCRADVEADGRSWRQCSAGQHGLRDCLPPKVSAVGAVPSSSHSTGHSTIAVKKSQGISRSTLPCSEHQHFASKSRDSTLTASPRQTVDAMGEFGAMMARVSGAI